MDTEAVNDVRDEAGLYNPQATSDIPEEFPSRCEWSECGARCERDVTHVVGVVDETPNLYVCSTHVTRADTEHIDTLIRTLNDLEL